MSELKRCFAALGFTARPETEQEIAEHYEQRLEKHKDSTESDRLARRVLRENYDMCLAELRKA